MDLWPMRRYRTDGAGVWGLGAGVWSLIDGLVWKGGEDRYGCVSILSGRIL